MPPRLFNKQDSPDNAPPRRPLSCRPLLPRRRGHCHSHLCEHPMRDLPQTMAMQQLQGSGAGQMSDLVRRLRAWHSRQAVVGDVQLYLDAAARIEALEAALRERDVDIAFCREAMRHADIDLTMALPMLTAEMQRAVRKTLDRIDEARLRSLAPEQDK